MKPETNQSKSNHIDEIVEELRRMVGFRKVVLWPEVPPGASLNALLQAYKEAGQRLKDNYLPANVDYAVGRISEELNSEVFG